MPYGNDSLPHVIISSSKRTRRLLHNAQLNRKTWFRKRRSLKKLNTIDAQETPEEDAGNTIRELMKEWNSIGHVPFKEKDKLYKQYHGVIDKLFDKLNLFRITEKIK